MPLHRHPCWTAAWLATALALGGCASVIRLENEVTTYTQGPAQQLPAPGDFYRFERLPSQQQSEAAPTQDAMEHLVQTALDKVGLHRQANTTPAPAWSVQVSARSVKMAHAPWDDPRDAWPGWGRGYVVTGRGRLVGVPMFPAPRPPYYQREVSLVLRRAGSTQVVYETRAAHDGPWHDSPVMWSALLDAALQGFPQPPSGTRQVVLEVPR